MRFLFLLTLLFINKSFAVPPRNVSLDLGLGSPQILFVGANVVISSHFQGGLSYTPIPNSILFHGGFDLSSYSLNIEHSGTVIEKFTITPHVNPSLLFLSPYLRFFPTSSNFYIQFSYPLIIINATISGTFKPESGDPTLLASVSSKITLIQPLPTISIGHIFCSKLFFINLSIGASFLTRISTSIEISGIFSDVFNSQSTNEVLQELKSNFENETNTLANEFKKNLFLIPSINISFGIML